MMTRAEYRLVKKARAQQIQRLVEEFKQLNRTEEDVIQRIVALHQNLGDLFHCKCGNTQLPSETRQRLSKCSVCNRDWWITAGTLFHGVKNLQPYVIAIYLKMRGMDALPCEIASVTGVSSSTASLIHKKVSMVVADEIGDEGESFSSLLFMELYQKRSTATPSFSHPRAEEEPFQLQRESAPIYEGHDEPSNAAPNLSHNDQLVFNEISADSISFDTLLARTKLTIPELSESVLTLDVFEKLIELDGTRYRLRAGVENVLRSKKPSNMEQVAVFINYITYRYQGMARKYVQLYVANFWCIMDQQRWGKDALLIACLRSKRKTRRDIAVYVSPGTIRMPAITRVYASVA